MSAICTQRTYIRRTGLTCRPVQYTAWTTLIVPVIKSDRSIQICGDNKCTEDKALRKDLYQI
ncbi:hypothetical protein T06_6669 [Trichinella sp. T6]|nr:hypothetical protein T06_6669 [Trichinella sp. T6]